MNKRKIISLLLMCMIISSNIISCNSSVKMSSSETPYYSLDIDGEKKYYSEDNTNVKDLKEFTSEIFGLMMNIDYKNNDDYVKQYDYYIEEMRQSYEEVGIKDRIKNTMVNYEVVRTLNNVEIKEIEFFKLNNKESAIATIDYVNTVSHGTQEYLDSIGFELNKKYLTTRVMSFQKENQDWRLVETLSISDSTQVE